MNQSIADSLMKITSAGWTVSFPPFEYGRGFEVTIAKGEMTHSQAWTSDEMLGQTLAALVTVVENFDGPVS